MKRGHDTHGEDGPIGPIGLETGNRGGKGVVHSDSSGHVRAQYL